MRKLITDWEVVDLGIEHSQYFQGFGVCGTNFDNCTYGIGDDAREALEDAIEQMAGGSEIEMDWDQLEKDILAKWPHFTNEKILKACSVTKYLEDSGEDTDEDCDIYYHVGIRWN
jgi:hypothetical protein